jgi:hypothetical protein
MISPNLINGHQGMDLNHSELPPDKSLHWPQCAKTLDSRLLVTTVSRYSIFLFTLALAAGIGQAQEAELARGSELLFPFKRDLQEALRLGLTKGPVQAISVCQVQAPKIAKALAQDDISLGRTSHRLRNPANSPPDWVGPILDAYVDNSANHAPRIVPLPNNRLGYVEPILIQPLCLTCHGEELAPEVASRINELYPKDRAVGFNIGDLRGVFWVEFPAEE